MSAYGDQLPHYATVTAAPDDDDDLTSSVQFTCPWQYGACHFYPSCGCETFDSHHLADNGPGHEREHHDRCWMDDWFKIGGAIYDGPDADDMQDNSVPLGLTRSGPIDIAFHVDYITWRFKETTS